MASQCCTTDKPGVAMEYTPLGRTEALRTGDAPSQCYLALPAEGAAVRGGVVLVYDIFGPSMQAKQVCDKLAAAGFAVCMPDFFHGTPWELANFPPKDGDKFGAFLDSVTYSDFTAEAGAAALKLAAHGARKMGVWGFCWGGGMAMRGCTDLPFSAGAAAHPAFINPELASKVTVPFCCLPAGDDKDTMIGIEKALRSGASGGATLVKAYADMHHGFAAARGDWAVPAQAAAATNAIETVVGFFGEHLA